MDFGMILSREYVSFFGFLVLFAFVITNKKIERNDKILFFSIIEMAITEIVAFEADHYLGNIDWRTLTRPLYMRIPLSAFGYVLRPAIVYAIILLADRSLRKKKKAILLAIPLSHTRVEPNRFCQTVIRPYVRKNLGNTFCIACGSFFV